MIIRIYDYNGKGKLVKIPDDYEYIEFDILNGDMVLTYPIQVDACNEPRKWIINEGHYKLTKDKKATLAGLFHDIATPSFKHCVDFLNGDYMTQESTED